MRTLLDSTLREWNARLDPIKYDDATAYLVAECWRISGLQADALTPRVVYAAHLVVSYRRPQWSSLAGLSGGFQLELGPWIRHDRAAEFGEARAAEIRADGHLVAVEVVERKPSSAYDPNRGLSFSTYSRRILSNRIVDWYRATFGDSRYGDRRLAVSLDELVARRRQSDGNSDDALEPGSRADFIDDLNRHAYRDLTEEAMTDALVG